MPVVIESSKNIIGAEIEINGSVERENIYSDNMSVVKYDKNKTTILISSNKEFLQILKLKTTENPEIKIINEIEETELNTKISPSKRAGEKLLGDYNNNGEVDLKDFMTFASTYGTTDLKCDIAPAMKGENIWSNIFCYSGTDGKVDLTDFIVFAKNYSKKLPTPIEDGFVFWTGETPTDRIFEIYNGKIVNNISYTGEWCINLTPSTGNFSFISTNNTPLWRVRLTEYDEIRFYIKGAIADNLKMNMSSWDDVTQSVQVSQNVFLKDYCNGKQADAQNGFILIKIPLTNLKTALWNINQLEKLHFSYEGTGPANSSIYIDDIKILHTALPDATTTEIKSVSDDTIMVSFETGPDKYDIPSTLLGTWKINGKFPLAVGRNSYTCDEGLDIFGASVRHNIFLKLDSPLENNKEYVIITPYLNTKSFVFNDKITKCDSIKINSVGYNAGATNNYANFGIYMGDLGSKQLLTTPTYQIIDNLTNQVIYQGTLKFFTDDTKGYSGEYVYRIDLSPIKTDGEYFISINGFGRSESFGYGKEYSKKISETLFRGLFHQRCGIALTKPYTNYTRGTCHTQVGMTQSTWGNGTFITCTSGTIMFEIHGGYHDAGDFDRRPMHTIIPIYMLTYYELFKEKFTDKQYNIPDIFDEHYNILGSGNGVPDFLDEALWGVLLYEYLQLDNGGVMAGTEANRHPGYGRDSAATDAMLYGTWAVTPHVTASSTGMFAQASRLIKPYDSVKAENLMQRAVKSWNYLETHPEAQVGLESQMVYASLQMYLLTATGVNDTDMNNKYHLKFRELINKVFVQGLGWPRQYKPGYLAIGAENEQMTFTPYFVSYLTENCIKDKTLSDYLKQQIINSANNCANFNNNRTYPVGDQVSGWAKATGQGWTADILCMAYKISENSSDKQRYFNAVSNMGDFNFGLNPLGRSFVTGMGYNPPNSPLHLDSYYTKYGLGAHSGEKLGNVPGIVVYGPSGMFGGYDYVKTVWSKLYPAAETLPAGRKYCDGWTWISANEFTTWETIVPNVCMHAFLN